MFGATIHGGQSTMFVDRFNTIVGDNSLQGTSANGGTNNTS